MHIIAYVHMIARYGATVKNRVGGDCPRMLPNAVTPGNPVIFNESVCTGCNRLADCIGVTEPESGRAFMMGRDWPDGECRNVVSLA